MFYGSLKQETKVLCTVFILLPQIWQTSLCKSLWRKHRAHMVGWCQLLRKGNQFPSVFSETLGKAWLQPSGRCCCLLLPWQGWTQTVSGWGPATAPEYPYFSSHYASIHWSGMWSISHLCLFFFFLSVSPNALIFSNLHSEKNSLLSLSTNVMNFYS